MTLRVIDLETTGTEPDTDRICEIASVDLVKDPLGMIGMKNAQQHICDPGIPIPCTASAVHQLIDDDVKGCPTFEDVLPSYLGGTVYIAHNAEFEQKFLDVALGKPNWFCTYKTALRVWPDAPSHSNQALRYWLGILSPFGIDRHFIDPHRALSDCYVTGEIFSRIIKLAPWAQLLQWSKEPALKTIINFGTKHKGQRYDEAADDYLEWIIKKSDMDESTKFSAQYWLANKKEKTP